MYYELLVLGRLMYGPYHGYFIINVVGDIIGPWQKVSTGALYPLLARLERDGLIEAVEPATVEPRRRRTAHVYQTTYAGRQRFHELMLNATTNLGDYQRLFRLKVPHFEFLTTDERVGLIEHYQDYCRAAIRHQEKNIRNLEGWLSELREQELEDQEVPGGYGSRKGYENALETVRHLTKQWRIELAWT
ncbi:MAG: PadR family transcriptional regulator, partial [Actinobacteria bacterium]|nr:PadR family transcriptional regulator [Actinomycetota bacterium]